MSRLSGQVSICNPHVTVGAFAVHIYNTNIVYFKPTYVPCMMLYTPSLKKRPTFGFL